MKPIHSDETRYAMLSLMMIAVACAAFAWFSMAQTAQKRAKKLVPVRVRRHDYRQY
jgi:hypothetical protein